MATQSYRERMKAARAEARAKRLAERDQRMRQLALMSEVRRLSLEAVKAGIRARGDKVSHYSLAQLRAQADALIAPWLIAQAKANIARWEAPKTVHTLSQSVDTSPASGEVSQ
jgi:hypothetical protein